MLKRALTFLFTATILAGCGGSKTPTPAPTKAQGVYAGTSSNNYSFESIVLPDDKYYAIYGTTAGNTFSLSGMMTGQGASNNGNYSASIIDYKYTGAVPTGTVTATYVPGSSLQGTITESGNTNTITFSGSGIPTSSFDYNAAAKLSDITGTWSGKILDGSSATITINSDGTVSGTMLHCPLTGTVSPDSSNKNFFNVSYTFDPSCIFPGAQGSGIAIDYLLPDGTTRQLLMGAELRLAPYPNAMCTAFTAQK